MRTLELKKNISDSARRALPDNKKCKMNSGILTKLSWALKIPTSGKSGPQGPLIMLGGRASLHTLFD